MTAAEVAAAGWVVGRVVRGGCRWGRSRRTTRRRCVPVHLVRPLPWRRWPRAAAASGTDRPGRGQLHRRPQLPAAAAANDLRDPAPGERAARGGQTSTRSVIPLGLDPPGFSTPGLDPAGLAAPTRSKLADPSGHRLRLLRCGGHGLRRRPARTGRGRGSAAKCSPPKCTSLMASHGAKPPINRISAPMMVWVIDCVAEAPRRYRSTHRAHR